MAAGRVAGLGAGVVARPELLGRLAGPARVTVVAAPAGSGKTVSFAPAAEHCRQVIELARRHGWTDELAVGLAYVILGAVLAWQMRLRKQSP